ncbi:MAG: hypothetical protein LC624_05515, partial [Halobacteriales archaeon]|nr:hypothetical protein [Halobacteriales archaeon]
MSRSFRPLAVALVLLMLAPAFTVALPAPTLPTQEPAKEQPYVKTDADFAAQASLDAQANPAERSRDAALPDDGGAQAPQGLPDEEKAKEVLSEVLTKPFSDPGVATQGCSLGANPTTLSEGVSVSFSLSGVSGDNCEFNFVPNAAFSYVEYLLPPTTPSDYDLYARKGAPPTTTTYDCRPFAGGTTFEVCDTAITDTTTIYAMAGWFSGSGTASISAQSVNAGCSLGTGNVALTDGTATNGYIAGIGATSCMFVLTPNPAFPVARFSVGASPADWNLYVRKGSAPTTSVFDCSSANFGGNIAETCDIALSDSTSIFA